MHLKNLFKKVAIFKVMIKKVDIKNVNLPQLELDPDGQNKHIVWTRGGGSGQTARH